MFQSLFRPAIALMERMPLGRKLMLVAVIFLLPITHFAWQLVAEQREQIEFARREVIGVEYLQPVLSLIQHIQQHRGAVSGMKNGEAHFAQLVAQKQNEIAEDIRQLDELTKRYGEQLKATDKWNSLKAEWQNLQQSVQNLSAQESFERHTQLIEKALDFCHYLGDSSNLSLDPEVDTYYMGQMTMEYASMTEHMGSVRAIGTGILAKRNAGTNLRQAFLQLQEVSEARQHSKKVERAWENVFSASISARDRLQKPYEEAKRQLEKYLALAEGIANGSSAKTVSAKEYFDIATRAIDAQYEILFATSKTLADALNARIARLSRERNFVSC